MPNDSSEEESQSFLPQTSRARGPGTPEAGGVGAMHLMIAHTANLVLLAALIVSLVVRPRSEYTGFYCEYAQDLPGKKLG